MSNADPIKRAQVALAAFAFCALGIAFSAEPAGSEDLTITGTPVAEIQVDLDVDARRAWRQQIPAVIILRRPRAS